MYDHSIKLDSSFLILETAEEDSVMRSKAPEQAHKCTLIGDSFVNYFGHNQVEH